MLKMPKNMFWTEFLFIRFPIDAKTFTRQMLLRFVLLLTVWFSGLLSYYIDGLIETFISIQRIYIDLFGTGFLILFGSYMVQRSLNEAIINIRSILSLNEVSFGKFHQRINLYTYSFIPCFLLSLFITFLLSDTFILQSQLLTESFELHVIWNLFYTYFVNLLSSTAIWIFVSIWITIFLVSRQPLNVELSPKIIDKFRDLSMLALWFSVGYFIALSFDILSFSISVPTTSIVDFIISPYLFFIAIGFIGILLPFYNIHSTLLKLKKRELLKIEDETESLTKQLDDILRKESSIQQSDQTIGIMARLFSLQIKERRVMEAQEWPIDVSFISKLGGLVLMPVMTKVFVDFISRYF